MMTNFPVRLLFFFIVPLILISLVWNYWINKQTAATINPPSLLTPQKIETPTAPEGEDPSESSSSWEFENQIDAPDVMAIKTKQKKRQETQHDEKIIYEMPITNKFLLQ